MKASVFRFILLTIAFLCKFLLVSHIKSKHANTEVSGCYAKSVNTSKEQQHMNSYLTLKTYSCYNPT